MISATDANDVWHDYIQTLKGAITTPGVIYKAKPLHGAAGVDYSAYYAAARQLIQDGVDLIVTAGNLAAQACKDATTQTQINPTPIVVASAGDLAELADGNLTGCTNGQQNIDILKARIGKMSQFNPKPTAVGIVGNDTVPPVGWAMHQAFVGYRRYWGFQLIYSLSDNRATLKTPQQFGKNPSLLFRIL